MGENIQEWLLMLSGFGSQKMEDIGIPSFVFLLLVSLFSSLFISMLYAYFYQNRATGSQIHRSFPLLGLSISGIFICIQFSLPLSLGLLGALSIVRFRTPIKEPEEIGFLMLVIASSIACATFNLAFLGILLAIAVFALILVRLTSQAFKGSLGCGMLLITLSESDYDTKQQELFAFLETQLKKGRLENLSSQENQTMISYSFAKPKKQNIAEFQAKLKQTLNISNFNIFFDQSTSV